MLVAALNHQFWSRLDAYQSETALHQLVWLCGLIHAGKLFKRSVITVTAEMLLIVARK